MSDPKFSIIGSGSIGIGWAIVFARAGYNVKVFDIEEAALKNFNTQVKARLELLRENELLAENPQAVLERIQTTLDLAEAVAEADYIQECGPESVEIKRDLFAKLLKLAKSDAIIARKSHFDFLYNSLKNNLVPLHIVGFLKIVDFQNFHVLENNNCLKGV